MARDFEKRVNDMMMALQNNKLIEDASAPAYINRQRIFSL